MRFGKLIQTYIKYNHMTYRQFGDLCRLSPGYLSMLINDKNPRTGKPPIPSLTAYMNVARAMGMTLDELFSTIDDAPVSLSPTDDLQDNSIQLSADEMDLVYAYRAADKRAREDAMNTLLSHPVAKEKSRA